MKTLTAVAGLVSLTAGVFGWFYYHSSKVVPETAAPVTLVPEAVEEAPELSVAKQEKIWDLEHFTFELEQKFGKAFTAALKDRQHEALLRFFRDEFSGVILDSDGRSKVTGKWWQEVRRVAGESGGPTKLPADECAMADYLVSALNDFSDVDRTKLRVLAIDEDLEVNDQWKLKLLLTASGTNVDGGPISWESTHDVSCQFASDDDIESGEIIARWNVLDDFIRSTRATFMKEVTAEVGLSELDLPDNWASNDYPRQYGLQMAVDDFNSDGYPDIAVSSLLGRQYLLQSRQGKSFQDVTLELGLPTVSSTEDSFLVSWIDMDNDGDPDLVMGGSLYRNEAGRQFKDVTITSGLRIGGNPIGCAVADYDLDGFLDLYVLYQESISDAKVGWLDDAESGAPNQLWRNVNGARFEDVTDETGTAGGKRHSFAAVWLHANDDLRPDLYVANDFGTNLLLMNRGDRFEEMAAAAQVGDFATSMGVAAGDIDGDGQSEIYVANMYSKMGRRIIGHVCAEDYPPGIFEQIEGSCAGNRLYKRSPNEELYRELAIPLGVNDVGWAYAPAFVDLDCDGFLDIYATTGFLSFDRKKPDG